MNKLVQSRYYPQTGLMWILAVIEIEIIQSKCNCFINIIIILCNVIVNII